MSLYLEDCRHLDWKTLELRSGHLRVVPGPAGRIDFVDEVPPGAERIECHGRIVTRAFAIGHHHIYSALARGMPAPRRSPRSFVEILELIWWNLDKQLDLDMIRASAVVTAIEAARCGSTFVIDHHASPNAPGDSLHVIAEALDEVGLSHLLCYELSDRDGSDRLERGIKETARYLETHPGLVGLHASFTVSDALLERAVDLARQHGTGIHIHVAEAASDQEDSVARFGKRVASRLHKAGALALPQTVLAHCLHLDEEERELVRSSAAWIVHNTQSNQNNGVGRFSSPGLGNRIFLGTDGMHSDMLSACRAAFLEEEALTPMDAYGQLRRVHDYLDMNGFASGSENDLIVLDYPTPTPVTPENWPAHVAYALDARHVATVIRQGKVLVEDGRMVTIDADREFAIAQEQAARLWRKL